MIAIGIGTEIGATEAARGGTMTVETTIEIGITGIRQGSQITKETAEAKDNTMIGLTTSEEMIDAKDHVLHKILTTVIDMKTYQVCQRLSLLR